MKRKALHTPQRPKPRSYFAFFLSLVAIALVAGLFGTAVKRTTRSHALLGPAAAGLGGELAPSASWVSQPPKAEQAPSVEPDPRPERREYWLAGFNFTEIVRLFYRVVNFLLTDPIGQFIVGGILYDASARVARTRKAQNIWYHARNLGIVLFLRFGATFVVAMHELGKRSDESGVQNSATEENPMPQVRLPKIFTERLDAEEKKAS